MKYLVAAAALTALLSTAPAHAQSEIDHNVQRAWDNLFNPPPPGDPRTNWERRRDAEARQRQAADRAAYDRQRDMEWCRYHQGAPGCGRY